MLAGGRGSRLGGAKACTQLAGVPLIAYPLRAARAADLEAIVIAKPGTPLPALEERVLHEPELPRHPLCGVVRALEYVAERGGAGELGAVAEQGEASPTRAVVVVACDLPFLTPELLQMLANIEGTAMAALDGRAQPTLCRCERRDLPALREALARSLAFQEALAERSPRIVGELELARFGDPERLLFNVNSETDLARAEGWLQS